MKAVPHIEQATPAMIVGRSVDNGLPPLGLGEPFALLGGDRLGPEFPLLFGHEWQPALLDRVVAATNACAAAGRRWFHLPPIVLSGPSGAGSTHAGRSLARAAGVQHVVLNVSDPLIAANLAASGEVGEALWATPPTVAMAATRCANPVVSIVGADQVDPDAVAAVLSMIDPATSGAWREDKLGVLMDLGEVSWVIQCAQPSRLAPQLLALAEIVTLASPDHRLISPLGTSVLLEVLDDLKIDPVRDGLAWEALLLREQRGWARSTKQLYATLRSLVLDALYRAKLGTDPDPPF